MHGVRLGSHARKRIAERQTAPEDVRNQLRPTSCGLEVRFVHRTRCIENVLQINHTLCSRHARITRNDEIRYDDASPQ